MERMPSTEGTDKSRRGVFRAHDALEHLRDPIHTMRELHRCLAPQGWLLSQTQHRRRGAFQDPTHVSFWSYTRSDKNRFINCPLRFQASRVKNFLPSKWAPGPPDRVGEGRSPEDRGARAWRRGDLKVFLVIWRQILEDGPHRISLVNLGRLRGFR
jgi:hypothetical protein